MEVQIKKNFPSVLQYTMTDGKVMYGQTKDVRTVEINGTNIELTDDDVTFKKVSDTEATYTLKVKDEAKKIDAVITVQITVKANQLHLNVTKIKNNLSEGIPEATVWRRTPSRRCPSRTRVSFPCVPARKMPNSLVLVCLPTRRILAIPTSQ